MIGIPFALERQNNETSHCLALLYGCRWPVDVTFESVLYSNYEIPYDSTMTEVKQMGN